MSLSAKLVYSASHLAWSQQGRLSHPKTAELASALLEWGMVPGQQVLLIVEELTQALKLSSRNMPAVVLTTPDRLLLSEILKADRVVIDAGALKYIQVWNAVITCKILSCPASSSTHKSTLPCGIHGRARTRHAMQQHAILNRGP